MEWKPLDIFPPLSTLQFFEPFDSWALESGRIFHSLWHPLARGPGERHKKLLPRRHTSRGVISSVRERRAA